MHLSDWLHLSLLAWENNWSSFSYLGKTWTKSEWQYLMVPDRRNVSRQNFVSVNLSYGFLSGGLLIFTLHPPMITSFSSNLLLFI